VLEARDRVGGRVHSRALADGSVVELGAEFVLPGNDVVRETAARLGLALYEKGTLYGEREPRGGTATHEEVVAAARTLRGGPGSIADELARAVPDADVREAIAARLEVSTAYPVGDQPAAVLADGAAGFGAFPSHGIAGGNQQLADALARLLGGRVHLSAVVHKVVWHDDGVVVSSGGVDVSADACVVATPAPHALEIAFEPPLPEWKRDALAAVRYGDAAKLFLPLAESVPPSAVLSVPDRYWTWTQLAPDGSPLQVASSFAGTAEALARLGVADGSQRWAESVRALRPELQFASAEPLLSTWPDGAYSARALSSPLDDDALARPVGPLHFAGEHTAGAWHALMEGALRSGLRAAAELL
jgi:monoamine oxidase